MLKQGVRYGIIREVKHLKRYKLSVMIPWLILSPLLGIAFILYHIGQFAEAVVDWLGTLVHRATMRLASRYDWNEVAKQQRASNPQKFKK